MPYYEDKNRRFNILTLGGIAAVGIATYRKEIAGSFARGLSNWASRLGETPAKFGLEAEVGRYLGYLNSVPRKAVEESMFARRFSGTLTNILKSDARYRGIEETLSNSLVNTMTRLHSLSKEGLSSSRVWEEEPFQEARQILRNHAVNNSLSFSDLQKEFSSAGGPLEASIEAARLAISSNKTSAATTKISSEVDALYVERLRKLSSDYKKRLPLYNDLELRPATIRDIHKFHDNEGLTKAGVELSAIISRVHNKELEVERAKLVSQAISPEEILRRSKVLKTQKEAERRDILAHLPIDDLLVSKNDDLIDLRAVRARIREVVGFTRDEFQIPLAPTLMGISPLKLFPWLSGKYGSKFARLSSWAKPLTAIDEIKAATAAAREANGYGEISAFDRMRNALTDVLIVGDKAIATTLEDNPSEIGVSINNLNGKWQVRNVGTGFNERVVSAMMFHGEDMTRVNPIIQRHIDNKSILRFLDKAGFVWDENESSIIKKVSGFLGIGNQHTPSKINELISIRTKFDDPTWIANAMEKAFDPSEEAKPEYIHTILRFINKNSGVSPQTFHGSLSREMLRELVASPQKNIALGKEAATAYKNLLEDSAVIDFFNHYSKVLGSRGGPTFSNNLYSMLRQYAADPTSVLESVERPFNKSIFSGINVFGEDDIIHGIDRMRKAMMEDLAIRFARPAASGLHEGLYKSFSEKLQGTERNRAISWLHGLYLQRVIEDHGIQGAYSRVLRSDKGNVRKVVQENLNWLKNKYANVFDTHVIPKEHELGSNIFIIKQGESFFNAAKRLSGWDNTSTKNISTLLTNINENIKAQGISDTTPNGSFIRGFLNDSWTKQYASFFTGLRTSNDWTSNTLTSYFFPERLNEMLSHFHLGLPGRDLGSGFDIYKGILLKRMLPLVAGVEYWKYANFELGQHGLPRPDHMLVEAKSRFRLWKSQYGLHGRDLERFPGLENYMSGRDPEEEQKWQQTGYEPIRKGRFWAFGSRTPLYGEKIDYWRPSFYQTGMSDWQETPVSDLNTDLYWQHSLLPTPKYPLSPITHFTDPYWWENAHAKDRPYLVSGPLASEYTPYGPLVNQTIGRFLKPRKILHPEYFSKDSVKRELREINESLKEAGKWDWKNGKDYWKSTPYSTHVEDRDMFSEFVHTGVAHSINERLSSLAASEATVLDKNSFYSRDNYDEDDQDAFVRGEGSITKVTALGTLQVKSLPSYPGYMIGNEKDTRNRRLTRRQVAEVNRLLHEKGRALEQLHAPRKYQDPTKYNDIMNSANFDVESARQFIYARTEEAGLYGYLSRKVFPFLELPKQGSILSTPQNAYGIEKRFWQQDLGGTIPGLPLVGDSLSELIRRFLPHKNRQIQEINPVLNNQASWLPGDNYFGGSFRRGDPFGRLKFGEYRLPSEAYEAVHGNKILSFRASSLGKSVDEMVRSLTGQDPGLSDYGQYVTELGTEWHRKIQSMWKRRGWAVGEEFNVYDPENDISGHIDAILKTEGGAVVTDIKTMSGKKFNNANKPYEEHLDQVNFYLHQVNLDKGLLVYVNRDDPSQIKEFPFAYSNTRYERVLDRLRKARYKVNEMIKSGEISRGDLYDDVTKFEILGDVAPYSSEYKQLRESLSASDQISDEQHQRVIDTRIRVAAQKRQLTLYPYRFSHLDERVKKQSFTVEKILNPMTVKVKESDHPLRLAGIRLSEERAMEAGYKSAEDALRKHGVYPGAKITALLEADEAKTIAKDTYGSMHSVIFSGNENVNLSLMNEGAAKEYRSWTGKPDWSATGVLARYNQDEIRSAARYERLAHLDTPLNTKLLKVRSPLEEWERGEVFGKNTGGWDNPIRDYVSPTITSIASKNTISASILGAAFSSYFFPRKTMKRKAAIFGAAVGAGLSILRNIHENNTGESWVPNRTRKRWELEEYFDTLKYVKYSALEAAAARRAKAEEHVDVYTYLDRAQGIGGYRRRETKELESLITDLKLEGYPDDTKEIVAAARDRIASLGETQGSTELGPWATTALLYRDLKDRTIYASTPHNFQNILASLPKREREIVPQIIQFGSPKEKERFYNLIPDYQKRVLGPYLNKDKKDLPEREPLTQYFQSHTLPSVNWKGWRPDIDINQIEQKAVVAEGLDPMSMGIYPQQITKAKEETAEVPTPTVHGSSGQISGTLHKLLSGKGVRDLSISVQVLDSEDSNADVDVNLYYDRHQEIINAIQNLL